MDSESKIYTLMNMHATEERKMYVFIQKKFKYFQKVLLDTFYFVR